MWILNCYNFYIDKVEKSSYACYVGSELWESKFDGLNWLRNKSIVDVWEIQKHKLYDSDSGPVQQLNFQSSRGDLAVIEGQRIGISSVRMVS